MATTNPYAATAKPFTATPGTNLINQTLTRTTTPRQAQYQTLTDAAATNATTANRAALQGAAQGAYGTQFGTGATAYNPVQTQVAAGPAVNPEASAQLQRYQTLTGNAADAIANAPDRVALAKQNFANSAPEYEATLDRATKLAAANGGLGSGMLSNDYGTIADERSRALDSALLQATSDSINDRYTALNAFSGLQGQQYGQEAATRGEQRTERGYNTDLDTANLGRTTAERNYGTSLDQSNQANKFARQQSAASLGQQDASNQIADRYQSLSALGSLEGQEYNRSGDALANDANERAYQYGLSRDATTDAQTQFQSEQAAQNQRFQQGVQLDTLGNKNSANAQNAYQGAAAANAQGAQGAFGGLASLLQSQGAGGNTAQNQALIDQIIASIRAGGVVPNTVPNTGTTPAGVTDLGYQF